MKQIRMVDLEGQYRRLKQEIDGAISEVIGSTAFINGAQVQVFAGHLAEYLGVKHVIPCANGTDALQLAMMALGLKPGDEVITPDFTFISTIEVIALLGLKPVIVDVDPQTFMLTPGDIREVITPKTRAIIPVHLFGQCADMHSILEIAGEHGLHVIEDTAQALGADIFLPGGRSSRAGTLGIIGTTSFFPSKNLGCYGDGGACITNDDNLAQTIRAMANHGMVTRYKYDQVGINSRLDTLQAAILDVKLGRLDDFNRRRQAVAQRYDAGLAGITALKTPARAGFSNHIFHQYTLKTRAADRDRLKEHLHGKGIPSMIYYPFPLHTQKAYAHLGYDKEDFPVTGELCRRVLSLPIHTEMEDDQLDHIIQSIQEFYKTAQA